MAAIFYKGQGIMVTTHGPGTLHLYTYGQLMPAMGGVFGAVTTTRSGVSHFIISHSYGYTRYAFYWDGQGHAECCVGENPKTYPVGKGWNEASWVKWGDHEVSVLNVSPEYFAGASEKRDVVTCFLLPNHLH